MACTVSEYRLSTCGGTGPDCDGHGVYWFRITFERHDRHLIKQLLYEHARSCSSMLLLLLRGPAPRSCSCFVLLPLHKCPSSR